jgi:hypothetical protein
MATYEPPVHMGEPKPPPTRSATTRKSEVTSQPMPTNTEPPWKTYPSRVKPDDVRRRVDEVTPEDTQEADVIFGWKLATLEEMYLQHNMP